MVNDAYTTRIDGKDAFRNDQDNTFTMQMPVSVSLEKTFETASGWIVAPTTDFTVTAQFGDTDYDTKLQVSGRVFPKQSRQIWQATFWDG